jgi:GTPase SAR1 family protein
LVIKIGSVGPQGSGKTRSIISINNFLSSNEYSWEEEEHLIGTTVVMPYTLTINKKKVIIADNPGQNSLEMVRKSVAQSGADYSGLIIFIDAIQFNFRGIGILHAESIAEYIKRQSLPVALITTKADLIQRFFQSDLLSRICYTLEHAVQNCVNGQKVPYFDKVRNIEVEFELRIENGWINFLQLEQLLVNALDRQFSIQIIPGFTTINIRLFVRSLLLGYCQYYKEQYPDYIQQFPVFNSLYDDKELINSLNYNRPSAIEFSTEWKVIASQSRTAITNKNEPPFQQSAFFANNIDYVLRQYCLATPTKAIEWQGRVRQKILDKGWNLVGNTFTDCITPGGIQNIIKIISDLNYVIEENTAKERKKKRVDFSNF